MKMRMSIARCCCGGGVIVVPPTYLANNHAWNIEEHDYSLMPAIPLPLVAGTNIYSPAGATNPEDFNLSLRVANSSNPSASALAYSTGGNKSSELDCTVTVVNDFTSRRAFQHLGEDLNQNLTTNPNRRNHMNVPKASFDATARWFITVDGAYNTSRNIYPDIDFGIGNLHCESIGTNWFIESSVAFQTINRYITPPPAYNGAATFEFELIAGTLSVYITDATYTRELLLDTPVVAGSAKTQYIVESRTNVITSLAVSDLDFELETGVVTQKTLGAWTFSDSDWSEAGGVLTLDNSAKTATVDLYKPDERYTAYQDITLANDTLHRISWETSGSDYDAIPAVAINDVVISQLPDVTYSKSNIDRLNEAYFFKTAATGDTKVSFFQWSQKNANVSNVKIEELT